MENFYDNIEAYLNGTLSKEEQEAFDKQLQVDEGLKKEVKIHRSIFDRLSVHYQSEAKEAAFKDKIASIGKQYQQATDNVRPLHPGKQRRNYAIGAILAIAASILLLLWAPWKTSLYDQFAKHPAARFTEMSTDQSLLNQAEASFNAEQYSEALNYLKEYTTDNPEDTEAQFFQAIALLETDQFNAAESIFKNISEGSTPFQYEAIWYLGLSELKKGDNTAAKTYLQQIPKGSSAYNKAQKLLPKL
jgi:tetratricopeptide (TPR) repeat protein